jgi:hypothetical protein
LFRSAPASCSVVRRQSCRDRPPAGHW